MKHNSTWLLSCLALGILITSCSGKKNDVDKQEQSVSTVLPDAKNEVTTQILKRRDFHHELVSNGKVSALGQADLRFETSEVIARIYVKNGEHVHKGQKLAELDKFRLEQKLSQAEGCFIESRIGTERCIDRTGIYLRRFQQSSCGNNETCESEE